MNKISKQQSKTSTDLTNNEYRFELTRQCKRLTSSITTHLMSIGSSRNCECSCESEISEFNVSFCVDEQILRLKITVKNAMTVTEQDSL